MVKVPDVLKEITDTLKSMQVTPEAKEFILTTLRNSQEAKAVESKQHISTFQRQYNSVKRELEVLLSALTKESITDAEYAKKKLELQAERSNIEARMSNLDLADDRFMEALETLIDLTSDIYKTFESSKIEGKRKILTTVFSNLEIEDKKLVFSIRKPFDLFVNGSSCVIWRE